VHGFPRFIPSGSPTPATELLVVQNASAAQRTSRRLPSLGQRGTLLLLGLPLRRVRVQRLPENRRLYPQL